MCSLVPGLDAPLWSDAKFTGSVGIKQPGDWQILSLLKSANARPGSETEDPIDFRSVLSVALQSFLYLPDIVRLHESGHCGGHVFAEIGSGSEQSSAWSGNPRCQQ